MFQTIKRSKFSKTYEVKNTKLRLIYVRGHKKPQWEMLNSLGWQPTTKAFLKKYLGVD